MRLRPSGKAGPIAVEPRRPSPVPARSGVDLGAHGADPGAVDRRRPGRCAQRVEAAIRAALTRPRDPAALVADVADMRAPHRRGATRPHRPGIASTGAAAWSTSSSSRSTCCCATRPQRPRSCARTRARRIAALGEAGVLPRRRARELIEALALWQHDPGAAGAALRGRPDPAMAPAAGAAASRAAAGAVDFAGLEADMTAACARGDAPGRGDSPGRPAQRASRQ